MHGIVSQLCLIDLPFSVFFFFKQKTAYEIPLRLVGSEMCIRDRGRTMNKDQVKGRLQEAKGKIKEVAGKVTGDEKTPVSYTHLTLPTKA